MIVHSATVPDLLGDIDPSVAGAAAPIGWLLRRTDTGAVYVKVGPDDTSWTKISDSFIYASLQPYIGGGFDGPLHFDGVSTVLGLVPVAGVYTLNRDIQGTTIVVDAGVEIITRNQRILATVSITGGGPTSKITGNGANAVVNAAGANPSGGFLTAGLNGSPGRTTAGTGSNASNASVFPSFYPTLGLTAPGADGGGSGQGGGGGAAGAFAGSSGGTITPRGAQFGCANMLSMWRGFSDGQSGGIFNIAAGGGAGSLADGATGKSGAGGSGGNYLVVCAPLISDIAFEAKGGKGGDASLGDATAAGGGGGGSGGFAAFIYWTRLGCTVTVDGGAHGLGAGGGSNGGRGADGIAQLWNLSQDGT